MKEIGAILAILGIMAIVFEFANRVPRLLIWIYNWGDTAAWGIKIGLVVVGAILYLAGSRKSAK